MILYHTKEFEIHKNNHNINVFILKARYVKRYTNADLKICQYLRLHIKIIC